VVHVVGKPVATVARGSSRQRAVCSVEHSVNSTCPIVDPKTGRIWLFLRRIDIATLTQGWNARRFLHQFATHSDDDGKVIVLFEKDGKSDQGFTILPPPPQTSPDGQFSESRCR
jgi:hypothetical protein